MRSSARAPHTVVPFAVENIVPFQLRLDVLADRLLKLEPAAQLVETLAVVVMVAGDFEDQVAAVVVPVRPGNRQQNQPRRR